MSVKRSSLGSFSSRKKSRKPARRSGGSKLTFESLERRELMAISGLPQRAGIGRLEVGNDDLVHPAIL